MSIYSKTPIAGVKYDPPSSMETSIKNIELAIKELRKYSVQEVDNLTAKEVYNDEQSMYRTLKVIKKLFERKNKVIANPPFGTITLNKTTFETHQSLPTIPSVIEDNSLTRNLSKDTPNFSSTGTIEMFLRGEDSAVKSIQSEIERPPKHNEREHLVTHKKLPKTNIKTRQKIIDWLQNIRLIKKNSVSTSEFHGYCRNGVLLYDLISRLEGRQAHIKKVERNPRTQTAVISNVKKCLEYLRSFEKLNSRFLWSVQEIVAGDEDVIWGLLDDLWYFYHKRISPLDHNYSKVVSRSSSKDFRKEFISDSKHDFEEKEIKASKVNQSQCMIEGMECNEQKRKNSYTTIHARRARSSSKKSRRLFTPSEKSNCSVSFKELDYESLTGKEQTTKLWLESLNLSVLNVGKSDELLKDPYRNGLLLCELGEVLTHQKVLHKYTNPVAVPQAHKNILNALRLFLDHSLIPPSYVDDEHVEKILRGHYNVIWSILTTIKGNTYKQRPQYLNTDIMNLTEQKVLNWLKQLQLIQSSIESILEFESEIRDGTLLCTIAQILSKRGLSGIFKNPKTESAVLMNIRKALECLRILGGIDTRYMWEEKNIFNGDRTVILGLFEDLCKYHESLS